VSGIEFAGSVTAACPKLNVTVPFCVEIVSG